MWAEAQVPNSFTPSHSRVRLDRGSLPFETLKGGSFREGIAEFQHLNYPAQMRPVPPYEFMARWNISDFVIKFSKKGYGKEWRKWTEHIPRVIAIQICPSWGLPTIQTVILLFAIFFITVMMSVV